MPSLPWQRDLISRDIYDVKNTFSSWDACMSEAYCKWPAIIGIVIGALVVISIIWCCARCLCCGAECCCGCLSCCNRCCPSPRQKNAGYEKPQAYPPYNSQYQSPSPMYFGGHGTPQTATFATSNKNYNADALPAMPTWSNAPSRHVEDDSLEMEKLGQPTQQQHLLPQHRRDDSDDSFEQNGDLGRMHTGHPQRELNPYQPYGQQEPLNNAYGQQTQAQTQYQQVSPYQESFHDYSQHQQYIASPTSPTAPSMYPPTYHTRPPSSVYTSPYSAAPPNYQTAPPSIASPPPQHAQMGGYGMGRNPANGSWRDV